MSADVVKAEFERLYERIEGTQKRAAEALSATLRRPDVYATYDPETG